MIHRIGFLLAIILFFSCNEKKVELTTGYDNVRASFLNPAPAYRPTCTWIWNSKLSDTLINNQLTDFRTKGIGGLIIKTDLSYGDPLFSNWNEKLEQVLTIGKRLGLQLWTPDLGRHRQKSDSVIALEINSFNFNNDSTYSVGSMREIQSLANQTGTGNRICKNNFISEPNFSFSNQKRILDNEFVGGMNRITQHELYTSALGIRKYKFANSFSNFQPCWNDYNIISDYIARMSCINSVGEQLNRILIISPTSFIGIDSITAPVVNNNSTNNNESVYQFQKFISQLEMAQVEFDIASESIINKNSTANDNNLIVGKRSYSLVVLPPLLKNIDSSTYKLLAVFLEKGGRVIAYQIPAMINDVYSNTIALLAKKHSNQWTTMHDIFNIDLLADETKKDIDILQLNNHTNLRHYRRTLSDAQILFLVNTSEKDISTGSIAMKGKSVEQWNALTGEINAYPFLKLGNKIVCNFNIPSNESLLLCIKDKDTTEQRMEEYVDKDLAFVNEINITRHMPNILPIDYCDLKIKSKTYTNIHVQDVSSNIFAITGRKKNTSMAVPLYQSIKSKNNKSIDKKGFEAIYHFKIDKEVDIKSLQLVVERSNIFKVLVNQKLVHPIPGKEWMNNDNVVFNIGDFTKVGTNSISLIADETIACAALQPIYVLGNFGLIIEQNTFSICPFKPMALGKWNEQGVPFYAHEILYSQSFNSENITAAKYILKLGQWSGMNARVIMNGQEAGSIFSSPYELDVTKYIEPDVNTVSVIITGNINTTFGATAKSNTPVEYHHQAYGLYDPLRMIVRLSK